MKKNELVERAIEIIEDCEVFVDCVNELDSWNGFADGWRCYPMDELDDLFCDCKVSEFLEKVDTSNFDLSDDYIQDTIYGLRSVSDIYEAYADETDEGSILDELIENYGNIDIHYINNELDELVEALCNEDFDEE